MIDFNVSHGIKNEEDLKILLGFEDVPLTIIPHVKAGFDKIATLRASIIRSYSKSERQEIGDILSLDPSLIPSVLNVIYTGKIEDFTKRVQDAYSQILGKQSYYTFRAIGNNSEMQGIHSWVERREFHLDEHERITFDRFRPLAGVRTRLVRWIEVNI